MPVIRKDHPGWTLPGYKYLGPFNSLNRGTPTNQLDAAAQKHDIQYTHLLNKQLYPYLFFNKADEDFLKEIKNHKGLAAYLTNFAFSLKKQYFPKHPPSKRKIHFINQANKAKKSKQSNPTDTNTNQETDTQTEMDQPMETNTNHPGGGGGGGQSGGVGHSTGNYDNRCFFHYEGEWCYITSHSTRQIILNQSNEDNYIVVETTKPANTTDANITARDNYHAQCKTPWAHLDPNAWGVWFSPSDMQKIITEADEIILESYEWKLFNINIKTATDLTTGQTVYNNDLIATLQLCHDSDNSLPYTPEAPRGATLGFLPWHCCTIPNYAYYIETWNTLRWQEPPYQQDGSANRTSGIDNSWQFICPEHKCEIDLLRTGDEFTSGIYKFHCKPYKNLKLWQSNRTIGKPPDIETNQHLQYHDYDPTRQKGMHWGDMGRYSTVQRPSPNETDQMKPYDIGFQIPFWNFTASYGGPTIRIAPPSAIPFVNGDPEQEMSEFKVIFDYAHGNFQPNDIDQYTKNQYGVIGQGQGNPGSWVQETLAWDKNTWDSPQADHRMAPLQPTNQTNTYTPYVGFNNYDIVYPQGQIWDKKLGTDHKPEMSCLAPFICEDTPPGQILLKLTPQYTNLFNPNTNTNPKIDTFANFFWSGKLKLKIKLRSNRQFNPYVLPTVPQGQEWAGKPTWEGHVRIPNFQTRQIKDIFY